jgi:hypothetical protein
MLIRCDQRLERIAHVTTGSRDRPVRRRKRVSVDLWIGAALCDITGSALLNGNFSYFVLTDPIRLTISRSEQY